MSLPRVSSVRLELSASRIGERENSTCEWVGRSGGQKGLHAGQAGGGKDGGCAPLEPGALHRDPLSHSHGDRGSSLSVEVFKQKNRLGSEEIIVRSRARSQWAAPVNDV